MIQNGDGQGHKRQRRGGPLSAALLLALVAFLAVFAAANPERAKNILLMLLGFGAVIFVHELGHFLAAKAVGIEVEAFSLGLNPLLLGVKRVADGYQVRVLPELVPGQEGKGALSLVIPRRGARAGETEYRLCLIPFGGFVKMLGQEDLAADRPSDNPRAFGNKPVWQRLIVISAGVVMNVAAAAIVFMAVFAKGVEMPPAVVGDVLPDSPAAKAGLRPGDQVVAIDGHQGVTFLEMMVAGAFAAEGEKIALDVRRPDGSRETLHLAPEMNPEQGMKMLGIMAPETLTVARVREPEALAEMRAAGFEPGDRIVAVNDRAISYPYELNDVLFPAPGVGSGERVNITVEREVRTGVREPRRIEVPMQLWPRGRAAGAVLGMAPRLRMARVTAGSSAEQAGAQAGDVLLRLGPLPNPTFAELRGYLAKHEGEAVELVVQREEEGQAREETLHPVPRSPDPWWRLWGRRPPLLGFTVGYDTDHLVVAACAEAAADRQPLHLPRGAIIVAVEGQPVWDWWGLIEQLTAARGAEVKISYRPSEGVELTETITTEAPEGNDWIGLAYRPDLGQLPILPLEPLREPVRGANWRENLSLGARTTAMFGAQTYLMLRGMITGEVELQAARGPIGILRMSYSIAEERSLTYYCYYVAMISVCIAAFNFLPLPILDGGYVVLLLVEKIKGSPVSVRVQTVITYAGLVLIGGLFLIVTYQDIVRWVTGQM